MFIQTEPTQDAATLKFLPGRQVLAQGTLHVRDRTEAANSPLAQRLFAIAGVSSVVCGSDFIAVTQQRGDWQLLKPQIMGAIMEHFMSGAPVVNQKDDAGSVRSDSLPATGGEAMLADEVRSALRQVIDPELGYNIVDLGLIYGVKIEGRVAHVTMTTTTAGCPATSYLRQGAYDRASSVPGIESVDVDLTYDPPWTPELMSPEAKAYFGVAG